MPFKVPGMSARDIRSMWKGHPDLTKAVLKANEQGWRIVKEGSTIAHSAPAKTGRTSPSRERHAQTQTQLDACEPMPRSVPPSTICSRPAPLAQNAPRPLCPTHDPLETVVD